MIEEGKINFLFLYFASFTSLIFCLIFIRNKFQKKKFVENSSQITGAHLRDFEKGFEGVKAICKPEI
jgi:hypothetical protein